MMRKPLFERLWVKVLFWVSLGFNLLVIGAVSGAMFLHEGPSGFRPPRPQDMALPYIRALPDNLRDDLRKSVGGELRGKAPNRAAMAEQLRQSADLLRANPFDPAALEEQLLARFNEMNEIQRVGTKRLVEVLSTMSDAERMDYADALLRAAQHGKKRK